MNSLYPHGSMVHAFRGEENSEYKEYLYQFELTSDGSYHCYRILKEENGLSIDEILFKSEDKINVVEYILYDDIDDLLDAMRILKLETTRIVNQGICFPYLEDVGLVPDLLNPDLIYGEENNIVSLIKNDSVFRKEQMKEMTVKDFYKKYELGE